MKIVVASGRQSAAIALLLTLACSLPAQRPPDVRRVLCIVDAESGTLRQVPVIVRRPGGDTVVASTGRPLRELIAPERYAEGQPWYIPSRVVNVAGEAYRPSEERVVPPRALRTFTFLRGVPAFVGGDSARVTRAATAAGDAEGPPPPSAIYLSLGPGCRFQRYVRIEPPRARSPGGPDTATFTNVRVFYATDRRATGEQRATKHYGSDRGPLEMGELTVSVPSTHEAGDVERPRWYRGEFSERESRHFILRLVTPLGEDSTFGRINAAVDSADTHALFVFVHGFKNSFEAAAYRTAQLAYDMGLDEVPVMYSWPSKGSLTGYRSDERQAEASVAGLDSFLVDLASRTRAREIHLIAHSMGTRLLTSALRTIAVRHAGKLFSQVVLAAPDIPVSAFDSTLISEIRSTLHDSSRVTLYASSADWALRASEVIHGERRVGQTGPQPTVIDGVDTVDATETSTDFLGHAYYARQGVVSDLVKLLVDRLDPKRRNLLERTFSQHLAYWFLSNHTSP